MNELLRQLERDLYEVKLYGVGDTVWDFNGILQRFSSELGIPMNKISQPIAIPL